MYSEKQRVDIRPNLVADAPRMILLPIRRHQIQEQSAHETYQAGFYARLPSSATVPADDV